MEDIAINVENVSKSFKISDKKGLWSMRWTQNKNKSFDALHNISISIKKGEVVGIIGTNGSGKTTLLRIISGIYKPDSGKVELKGRLSPLMQIGAGFQGELAARENIIINGMLLGLSKSFIEKKIDAIMEFAELEKFSNMKLKHFSSGMKARLAFAIAMQMDPDIFLIDEIISVGDKNFRDKSYKSFLSLKEKKKTILMATHNLGTLSQICDKVLLLHKGEKITFGIPQEVLKQYNEING